MKVKCDHRSKFPRHTRHCQGPWRREIPSVAPFPLIHRLRSDIRILKTREEHSVGHMDALGRSHYSFHGSKKNAYYPGVLNVMPVLQRFVVLLYNQRSLCQGVNDARKVLFSQKG